MKNFLFKLRVAYRNIFKSRGRSVVVLLTLMVLMILSVVIFNIHDNLVRIFSMEYQEVYQTVDLTVSYDNYSNSRIVNVSTINDDYSEYFNYSATYFNLYSLMESEDDSFYAQVYSSSLGEFERVMDFDLDSINDGEMFITQSLADRFQLNKNDALSMLIGSQEINYVIREILPDQGLFSENSVFVPKEELLTKTLWFSAPDLGNMIYLDVKDEYSILAVRDLLLGDAAYANSLVKETVDHEQAKTRADYNASVLLGIGVLAFLAVIMVVRSIYPLLFRDFSQQIGVIRILGGNDGFAYQIWMIQFCLYLLISVPMGLIFSRVILDAGARAYGVYTSVGFNPWYLLLAVAFFLAVNVLGTIGRYAHYKKQSEMSLSNDARFEKQKSVVYAAIAAGAVLLVNWIIDPFPKFQGMITVVTVIVFTFSFLSMILKIFPIIFKKKDSFFSLYSSKHLRDNKILHNSVKVIFVSLVIIAISMTVSGVMKTEILNAFDEIRIDYAVTNIYNFNDDLVTEIETNNQIDSAVKGAMFRDGTLQVDEDTTRRVQFFLSVRPENISELFTFSLSAEILAKLADPTILYVALPYQYEKTSQLRVGDEVTFRLSQNIPSEKFIIAGFFENSYEGIYLSNISYSDKYMDSDLTNTVFIRSSNGDLQKDLIQRYSGKMYYVFSADDLLLNETKMVYRTVDFVVILIWALVACFMIVIINNSLLQFYALKADYAKFKILGCGDGDLYKHILLEILLVMLIALGAGFVNSLIVLSCFPSLMIMVGFYFKFEYPIGEVLGYLLMGTAVFLLSYLYYFVKIKHINIIQETKNL
jgi:ABC-type antimicrobial peptide transport system permease subunit